MAITTLNLRGLNRSDTASSGQVVTATSATAMDFQAAGGAWNKIATQTASDSASVEFDGNLTDTYRVYKIIADNIVPATDGQGLRITLKRDGEGSYNTGSTDYWHAGDRMRQSVGGGTGALGSHVDDQSDPAIDGRSDYGTATGEVGNFEMTIFPRTGKYAHVHLYEMGGDSYTNNIWTTVIGKLNTAGDCQSIKIAFGSGNIATGNFVLYGLSI
tara:strand:+ start:822 stop:1466 length:645 start_codon:yes stop_codon:yes gene_type:complete